VDPERTDLAATGADPGVAWIVALGMIALGGGLVVLRRIRARRS
jgi:LPXTG-motif cell wall-anchored protein